MSIESSPGEGCGFYELESEIDEQGFNAIRDTLARNEFTLIDAGNVADARNGRYLAWLEVSPPISSERRFQIAREIGHVLNIPKAA